MCPSISEYNQMKKKITNDTKKKKKAKKESQLFHTMPDGTKMTGAKHTKNSKPIKTKTKPKKKNDKKKIVIEKSKY